MYRERKREREGETAGHSFKNTHNMYHSTSIYIIQFPILN